MTIEIICDLIIGVGVFVTTTIYFIHEIINSSAFIKRIEKIQKYIEGNKE